MTELYPDAEVATAESFRFAGFHLDPGDRRLVRDGTPIELGGRYLDALVLLVREQGRLVTKDRFMAEVWRGVPVTDEALTQCIRTLRRQLGDDATSPRLIETVPRHGYRFIAPVETMPGEPSAPMADDLPSGVPPARSEVLRLGAAGTLGGGLAGLAGGLLYGFLGASASSAAAMGAASVLLVLACVTTAVAVIGGAGVAFGIAAVSAGRPAAWCVAGGAVGGLLVGATVKLLGGDAFGLLLGQSPGDITGAAEGAALGGAVGLGAWLAAGTSSLRRATLLGAATGGGAGLLIPLLGGRLMAGSLDELARSFEGSHLELAPLGALLGERGFGPVSLAVTGCLEGMLFGACVVGAMTLARRNVGR